MDKAVRALFDMSSVQLRSIVTPGDHVLVKVNMGCAGVRAPADRYTTHPALAESVIKSLKTLGAVVSFGDDVARSGNHCEHIWRTTGMRAVADRTGAHLIDFVASGAREVRGSSRYPRSYFVSNAYFNADVVVNLANFRSHSDVVISGAIKNMFGCVIGKRKALIHSLFRNDPKGFARAIADIHRVVKPQFSFLDATSVVEGHGIGTSVRAVGVLLASSDPVALDALAAQIVGYERLKVWTTYYAERLGLGCADPKQIDVQCDEAVLPTVRLRYPSLPRPPKQSLYARASNLANVTLLRPRPVIGDGCSLCGKCADRCPARCIGKTSAGQYEIALKYCADCGCCIKVCEAQAISLAHVGCARLVRRILRKNVTYDGTSEQCRANLISYLKGVHREFTTDELVRCLGATFDQRYTTASVSQALNDLVIQGLAAKADVGGKCRYRWTNSADPKDGEATRDSAQLATPSCLDTQTV